MKRILFFAIYLALIAAVLFVFRRRSGGAAMRPGLAQPGQTGKATLEQKLETLAECGFKLAPPFTVADLLAELSREEYEKPGFEALLFGLGSEADFETARGPFCLNLWHFDTECIENEGDYANIVARMAQMAQGALPLENISDHLDPEKEEAWAAFSLNGHSHRINLEYQDDWVDGALFTHLAALLEKTAPSLRFIYYDTGYQDCLLGCVTGEQLARLRRLGLNFTPLGTDS